MNDKSQMPAARALISVSDKTGLVDFATFLHEWRVEIISTGGTAKTLREAGIPVREVADYTGFPEMMDGRVKTLHPKIHGGILALRGNPDHMSALVEHRIEAIDFVVVNLYPFEEAVAAGADFATCIEKIDIGGPSLIRAAAKNHAHVTVVVDAGDYPLVCGDMAENAGATTVGLRRTLAAKAYGRTGAYDAAISAWFAARAGQSFPDRMVFAGSRRQGLRYGENPHQKAAFYVTSAPRRGIATAVQIQGKELSYNNLNDTDAAFELVSEFDPGLEGPVAAIIKHANPCGVARGDSPAAAYARALRCDPVSAFGGIVAFNLPLDAAAAAEIVKIFTEVVIAPGATVEAREILAGRRNLRLLLTDGLADPAAGGVAVRSVAGGFLVQGRDNGRIAAEDLEVVTKRAPGKAEIADLLFAFRVAKHVKSNAIVYVRRGATVGIGAGQMSRLDSSRIAARKSAEAAAALGRDEPLAKGSVVASDAFFPFADGLLAAAEAGATAVIQPGGSMRDKEVIAAADEAGLAMVMTRMRHFRH